MNYDQIGSTTTHAGHDIILVMVSPYDIYLASRSRWREETGEIIIIDDNIPRSRNYNTTISKRRGGKKGLVVFCIYIVFEACTVS